MLQMQPLSFPKLEKFTGGDPSQYLKTLGASSQYLFCSRISNGSYGAVYLGGDMKSGEVVAIKHEFYGFSQSTLRELNILKSVGDHPNIVKYKDIFVDGKERVYIVMEYLPFDLHKFIQSKYSPWPTSLVKNIMRQILQGVDFLHSNGILHRDLKPSNILINRKLELKICDFGLSTRKNGFDAYSPGVCTLWYRAPEVLVDSEWYSEAIDMWSVGCIMAEVAVKAVLFACSSEMEQFRQIRWFRYDEGGSTRLRRMLTANAITVGGPCLSSLGFDLLERLLDYSPSERITAKDALLHPWFKEE